MSRAVDVLAKVVEFLNAAPLSPLKRRATQGAIGMGAFASWEPVEDFEVAISVEFRVDVASQCMVPTVRLSAPSLNTTNLVAAGQSIQFLGEAVRVANDLAAILAGEKVTLNDL